MDDNADVWMAALELINRLTAMTQSGEVAWKYSGPLSQAKLEHRGTEYILDFPRGETTLLVDGVLVWKGYGLYDLRRAICNRVPHPEPVPTPAPMDYRAPSALARALRSLE